MPRLAQYLYKFFYDRFILSGVFNGFISTSTKQGKENNNNNNNKNVDKILKTPENPTAVPHAAKDPPENYSPTEFSNKSFCPPEQFDLKVFRPLAADEILGPCANKSGDYKNPEYYAYHRYSHVDLFREAMKFRECGPTVCIKCTDEAEEKEQDASDCDPFKMEEKQSDSDCKDESKQEGKDEKNNKDTKLNDDGNLTCGTVFLISKEGTNGASRQNLNFIPLYAQTQRTEEKEKSSKNVADIDKNISEERRFDKIIKLDEESRDDNILNPGTIIKQPKANKNLDLSQQTNEHTSSLTIYSHAKEVQIIGPDPHEISWTEVCPDTRYNAGNKFTRKIVLEIAKIEDEKVNEHNLNLDSQLTKETSETSEGVNAHLSKTLLPTEEAQKSTEKISGSEKTGSDTGADDKK